MKKYLSTFIMLMTAGAMYGQLEVNSIGQVNINNPVNFPATVNIEGVGMLLKGTRGGTTSSSGNTNPVIEAQNNSTSSNWATEPFRNSWKWSREQTMCLKPEGHSLSGRMSR